MHYDPRLLIFDFDGVVADSEVLANRFLAEFLTQEGLPTTFEQSLERYKGRRWADTAQRISDSLGRPLDDDFQSRYRAFTGGRMRTDVGPVPGVAPFLQAQSHRDLCVASSSSFDWLNHCVDKFGFRQHLASNLFSATVLERGKPHPDIFLHAASEMGHEPDHCIVIEDSPAGIEGARAAGMIAIGFTGGSQARAVDTEKLTAAGAHHVVASYDALTRLLR